jgi:integrase
MAENIRAMCNYCEKPFEHKRNIPGHLENSCLIYSLFKNCNGTWTAQNIRDLIEEKANREMEYLKQRNDELVKENETLIKVIREKEEENTLLKNVNSELNTILNNHCDGEGPKRQDFPLTSGNILTSIDRMRPKERIKKQYKSTWNEYKSWSQSKGKNELLPSTADEYLGDMLKKSDYSTTIGKKRGQIQTILRNTTKNNFILQRIDKKLKTRRTPKHLSQQELDAIFRGEIKIDEECKVAIFLEVYTGVRVNVTANLKIEHLIFLDLDSACIKVPDTKTKYPDITVDTKTIDFVKTYVEAYRSDIEAREGYLVTAGKSNNHDTRANTLQKKLNNLFKKLSETHSRVIRTAYTTHDLRRTHGYLKKHQIDEENEGIARAQKALNHKNPHVTKKHYLVNTEEPQIHENELRNDLFRGRRHFSIADVNTEDLENFKQVFYTALEERGCKFNDDLSMDFFVNTKLAPVHQINADIFRSFKEKSRNMIYAPIMLEKDDVQGWLVRAVNPIPPCTLICEYSGQVMKLSHAPVSDSRMDFMKYSGCDYVVVPDRVGNIARFISGVSCENRDKANLLTMKCNIDDNLHILLFTSRDVEAGEILYYDYNAGPLKEYETSNFVYKKK